MSLRLSDLELRRRPPDRALVAEMRLCWTPAILNSTRALRSGTTAKVVSPCLCSGKWFPARNRPSPSEQIGLRDASFVSLGQGQAQTLPSPILGLIND